jgi:hypothetical protein
MARVRGRAGGLVLINELGTSETQTRGLDESEVVLRSMRLLK